VVTICTTCSNILWRVGWYTPLRRLLVWMIGVISSCLHTRS
jgi:hypothetical protein